MNNIHIGSIIKQKVEENSLSVKEFAGRINCERTNVYHIFKQRSIDIERLIKISEVLDYDFISKIYIKQNKNINNPPRKIYIAVELDADPLQQLTLPDEFIRLMKK